MAEAVVGLVIGVAGLAGPFGSCLDAFELVQLAKCEERDLDLMYQKLDNQQARLVVLWRDASSDERSKSSRRHQPKNQQHHRAQLAIHLLLTEG